MSYGREHWFDTLRHFTIKLNTVSHQIAGLDFSLKQGRFVCFYMKSQVVFGIFFSIWRHFSTMHTQIFFVCRCKSPNRNLQAHMCMHGCVGSVVLGQHKPPAAPRGDRQLAVLLVLVIVVMPGKALVI